MVVKTTNIKGICLIHCRADTYKYILDKDIGSAAVVHVATKIASHFSVHNVSLFILPCNVF